MKRIFAGAVLLLCALAVDAQVQPRPGGSSQITGVSGNGHTLATVSGPLTPGDGVVPDANGNLTDTGSPAGGGSGGGLFAGILGTLPTASGTGLTTAFNHTGTYTTGNVGTGVLISDPTGSGSVAIQGQLAAYPGVPFTLTTLLSQPIGVNNSGFGISISQAATTGKSIWFGPFFSGGWTNLTYTFSAPNTLGTQLATATISAQPFIWLRLKDDGTNITFYYSYDGIVWTQEYTVAKSASFMVGNFNFLGVVLVTGGAQSTVLQSWTITTP